MKKAGKDLDEYAERPRQNLTAVIIDVESEEKLLNENAWNKKDGV